MMAFRPLLYLGELCPGQLGQVLHALVPLALLRVVDDLKLESEDRQAVVVLDGRVHVEVVDVLVDHVQLQRESGHNNWREIDCIVSILFLYCISILQ